MLRKLFQDQILCPKIRFFFFPNQRRSYEAPQPQSMAFNQNIHRPLRKILQQFIHISIKRTFSQTKLAKLALFNLKLLQPYTERSKIRTLIIIHLNNTISNFHSIYKDPMNQNPSKFNLYMIKRARFPI